MIGARKFLIPFVAALSSCNGSTSPEPTELPDWSAPISVDSTQIYVPVAWNKILPWHPRPWRNGVRIDSGGWGSSSPLLGPIQTAAPLSPGEFYRRESAGKEKRPGNPDPFFYLKVTFEFPMPPPQRTWWGGFKQERSFPFAFDRLELAYRAPIEEVRQPYIELLAGLKPTDGEDVGDGWREVKREYDGRTLSLRFDADDWASRGGDLPRHLAASFSPALWSHYIPLSLERWSASFETQSLPVEYWRARYETADDLFTWLQKPPAQRDATQRFVWWTDLKFRPER